MLRPSNLLWILALGLLLPSLISGCSRETAETTAPDYQVGAIEGYIRAGGAPAQAKIRAMTMTDWDDSRFRTRTDSTGWYHMDLPTGTYRLEILPPDTGDGFSSGSSRMDTVRIGSSLRRFDLNEGQLRVRVAVPSFLEGRSITCTTTGFTLAFDSGTQAVVQGGTLEWTFPLIRPGAIYVQLMIGDSWLWLPGVRAEDHADRIVVGSGAPTLYQADLRGMSEVAGSVHGSWETMGASSPSISAFSMDSVLVSSDRTGNDGSFALDVFPAQPVRILVGGDNSRGLVWAGGDSYASGAVYDLRAGERSDVVRVEESGILCNLDWPNHPDLENPRVEVYDDRVQMVAEWYGSHRVPIPCLAPGRYYLHVAHDWQSSWAPTWFDGAEYFANATPVEITSWGQTIEVTIHLMDGGRIDGTILTAAGGTTDNPVYLYDSDGASLYETWSHGANGTFIFQGLANGSYRAAAAPSYTARWWYPGTFDPDSAQAITVSAHGTVSGINWRLP